MLLDIFNKKKRKGKKDNYCSFDLDEIEEINKLNNEKIKKLNNNSIISNIDNNKDVSENDEIIDDNITEVESSNKIDNDKNDNNIIDDSTIMESVENIIEEKKQDNSSFINLDKEYQIKIMNMWESLDVYELKQDILKGEDILNHNYTLSYCEDAYKYVTYIRDKYSIVIKYLIGFNNEKNGIYNKTIFSNNKIEEWRYLEEYIKLLEKIKNFRAKQFNLSGI